MPENVNLVPEVSGLLGLSRQFFRLNNKKSTHSNSQSPVCIEEEEKIFSKDS